MIAQRSFPGAPESVPSARHFVASVLSDLPKDLLERAILMVSELATNAVKHGGTDFEILVECTSNELHVEIADTGHGAPTVRRALPQDSSGRGLHIVETLADEWGVRPARSGPGKTVWFTLLLTADNQDRNRAESR
jgi:anti-sigma regulatory factor (Ser/Thr protein kinase)